MALFISTISSIIIINTLTQNQFITIIPIIIISSGLIISYIYIRRTTPNKIIKIKLIKSTIIVIIITQQTRFITKTTKIINKLNNERITKFTIIIIIITIILLITNLIIKKNNGPLKKFK